MLIRCLAVICLVAIGLSACKRDAWQKITDCMNSGNAYESCRGAVGDEYPEKHAEKVRKAAEQGDAQAQAQLGWKYYKGTGVPQNHAEAFAWWRKAAEQGNKSAQYWLETIKYEPE